MKKAIVIDDTKNIRTLLTTCLELNGFQVTAASSGEEALNLFAISSFDLAFLDIKMPEISGTEVLRRLRSKGITIPVVIMTAFGTVKNAVECTKLGAVAYLQKPFTADKVKILLEEFKYNDAEENNVKSCLAVGKNLLQIGRIEEAYNKFKTALSIDPCCSECYELIAEIHQRKGETEKASKFYAVSQQFKI